MSGQRSHQPRCLSAMAHTRAQHYGDSMRDSKKKGVYQIRCLLAVRSRRGKVPEAGEFPERTRDYAVGGDIQ
jgi:acid phosphatase class B